MSYTEGSIKVKRALISVSDKTGLEDLCRGLAAHGVSMISTGGTAKAIKGFGLDVTQVSDVTGFPEIMDGRVKTLNPLIHGGILANRDIDEHMASATEHGITPIDMVVVNLYPFAQTIADPGTTLSEAIEQIDIGGPAMVRASAKNFRHVAILVDPGDYQTVLAELDRSDGHLERGLLQGLAQKAFSHTSSYDGTVSEYLAGGRDSLPKSIHVSLERVDELRYGENPHQKAAFYRNTGDSSTGVAGAVQLGGKELSYNNIIDLESAWKLSTEWVEPACAIIKHNNPCGAAIGSSATDAYRKAFASDTVSAFGSVIGFSVEVDLECATALSDLFVEAVIAPSYSEDALEKLKEKKNLRIMLSAPAPSSSAEVRMVAGGAVVQSRDLVDATDDDWSLVTPRETTREELTDLIFAWKVAAYVKSNAIVLAKNGATVGVGAGQMSRLDSSFLALRKAGDRAKGSVAASDAFFPFSDALAVLVEEGGVVACAHPGGSIRDDEVTEYAKGKGISLYHTRKRHFRH